MFDGLRVYIESHVAFNRVRLMAGAVEHTAMDTGEVLSNSLDYDVFKVKIKDGEIPSVQIDGSLHRFYCDGHNDTPFSFRQVRKAVEKLAWLFCIDLRQPCINRMEFGVNIHTPFSRHNIGKSFCIRKHYRSI